jgi:hypothetical protein
MRRTTQRGIVITGNLLSVSDAVGVGVMENRFCKEHSSHLRVAWSAARNESQARHPPEVPGRLFLAEVARTHGDDDETKSHSCNLLNRLSRGGGHGAV